LLVSVAANCHSDNQLFHRTIHWS